MKVRPFGVRQSVVSASTATLAVALLVGGLILRSQLRESLERSIAEQTRTRAEGVAALIATGNFGSILQPSERTPAWVQVVADNGEVVASTPNVSALAVPFAPVIAGDATTVRRLAGLAIDTGERVVVASVPVTTAGHRAVVLAASPLDLADATDRRVLSLLLVLFPTLLAVAAFVVWAAARRALRPVEDIRAEVASITSSDLSKRVAVPLAVDEVSALAMTMNDTLERLERSATRQRRFVGDASHELRSPLASLKNQLDASLYDHDDPAWLAVASDMRIDLDRLERLVADLLLLAHHDEGERPATEPLDFGYLVRTEMTRRPRAPGVSRIVRAENVLVNGNAAALARVLRNLVDNAERHATSAVLITVERSGASVLLRVADDGPGIPLGEHRAVFERFHRLDEARSSDAGGTGLGLAIVLELVTDHGGTVTIDTETAMRGASGACFTVRLPTLP